MFALRSQWSTMIFETYFRFWRNFIFGTFLPPEVTFVHATFRVWISEILVRNSLIRMIFITFVYVLLIWSSKDFEIVICGRIKLKNPAQIWQIENLNKRKRIFCLIMHKSCGYFYDFHSDESDRFGCKYFFLYWFTFIRIFMVLLTRSRNNFSLDTFLKLFKKSQFVGGGCCRLV